MKISKRTTTLLAIIVGGAGVLLIFSIINDKSPTKTPPQHKTYTGRVQLIDVEGMATDNAGVYEISTDSRVVKVSLSSGESSCDRTAIEVPDLKVGDSAEVRGKALADGTVQICEAGSYIKKAGR